MTFDATARSCESWLKRSVEIEVVKFWSVFNTFGVDDEEEVDASSPYMFTRPDFELGSREVMLE